MGLISTEANVTLNPANISYYEELGYEIPRYRRPNNRMCVKRGTSIKVKVEHLSKGCTALVDVECDCCKDILTMEYFIYHTYNHDNKYYCKPCANKLLRTGENNNNYNHNLTDEERQERRNYPEYIEFIKSVMARDNYTCQCCGKNTTDDKIDIEVHHLYGYSAFPEYRIDQTQSITLCKECHKAFHSWHVSKYGNKNKGNCTRNDFNDWLGYALSELEKYDGQLLTTRKIYDYEDNKIYESVSDYVKHTGAKHSNVYYCCNHKVRVKKYTNKNGETYTRNSRVLTVKGHHLFWLDEYESLTKEEIDSYVNMTHKYHKNKKIESEVA